MASVTPDIDDQEAQDRAYSPEELRKREQEAQAASSETPEGVDGAREAEENPSGPAGAAAGEFVNNFTGKGKKGKEKAAKGVRGLFKEKGPVIAIGGGVGLGGILLLVLVVPSLLLFHLLANMFDTYDPSSTALAKVAQVMLLNKLGANGATAGCDVIKIVCRFKTPSNELLRELRDNGITPLDKAGKPMNIDVDAKWPAERPASFKVSSFHTESGDELIVKAGDLKSALQSNTTFRLAFNKVIKRLGNRAFSRFSPAFLKVITDWKLNLRDTLSGKKGADGKTATINESITSSIDPEASAAAGEAASEEAESAASKLATRLSSITTKVSKIVGSKLTLVANASKGSGVVLAAALSCMAAAVPSMLKQAMTSIQQTSMVTAGAPVISAMSAVKAGDSTPEEASALGTAWTETDSNGKSALDAAGINYSLHQDTNTTADPTYVNTMPEAYGQALTSIETTDAIVNNPATQATCALLDNPIAAAGISAGINAAFIGTTSVETFGISVAVNFIAGIAAEVAIDSFSSNISDAISQQIGPALAGVTQPTLDKMTAPGQNFGNVEAHTLGVLSAAKGGNEFGNYLTTDQVPTYAKQIQAQNLADAEYDRATLSPFDASSKYTFLGSIVDNFLPYYGSLSSIGGTLSTIGSIIPMSIGSVLGLSTSSAADDGSIYTNACPSTDTSVTQDANGKTMAGDIYCDKVAAMLVPDNYDPNSIVDQMTTNGAIDDSTGAPVQDNEATKVIDNLTSVGSFSLNAPSYSDWLATCSDPANAAGCTNDGSDATTESYSLYTASNDMSSMLDSDLSSDASSDSAGQASQTVGLLDNLNTPVPNENAAGIAQLMGSFGSLLSSSFSLLKAYNGSLLAAATPASSILTTLQGFTLWR